MAGKSFSLVLHSHIPYVLAHGSWPHGMDWLYEAAAEETGQTDDPIAVRLQEETDTLCNWCHFGITRPKKQPAGTVSVPSRSKKRWVSM